MRTHLDLFSGIGGFSLAAHWCGVETIGFAEIDPYASAVLKKHWPGVTNYGDIRNVPAVGNVWLITGGFPCQPFSVSGERRGKADDRWLWPAMLDVVKRVRPTWVLAENVLGLIVAIDEVLDDLEACGYSASAMVIPACAVGAQHLRNRFWIVANPDSPGLPPSRQCGETAGTAAGVALEPTAPGVCRPESDPSLLRKIHGVPHRVDRIKCLGNAIVPQVAAQIIKAMIESERYEP